MGPSEVARSAFDGRGCAANTGSVAYI